MLRYPCAGISGIVELTVIGRESRRDDLPKAEWVDEQASQRKRMVDVDFTRLPLRKFSVVCNQELKDA
jgi:hypothetical protein